MSILPDYLPQPGKKRFGFPIGVLVRMLIGILLFVLLIFTPGGSMNSGRGLVFSILMIVTIPSALLIVEWKNPGLLEERSKRHKDAKLFDKIWIPFYALALASLFLFSFPAGDLRLSEFMPDETVAPGIIFHILGWILIISALSINPFAENLVRIQKDRRHRVISEGAYRYVRHPMYAGLILVFFGWALILGAWLSLASAAVLTILVFIRTALEDGTLKRELAGYEEYTRETQYRLIPGVW
jgi:protein-S-isoprenylcysteine O-methyltransferase Ste14